MLLQPFVNYLNLSERQTIEPVHFRQMSIAMPFTQLPKTHDSNNSAQVIQKPCKCSNILRANSQNDKENSRHHTVDKRIIRQGPLQNELLETENSKCHNS